MSRLGCSCVCCYVLCTVRVLVQYFLLFCLFCSVGSPRRTDRYCELLCDTFDLEDSTIHWWFIRDSRTVGCCEIIRTHCHAGSVQYTIQYRNLYEYLITRGQRNKYFTVQQYGTVSCLVYWTVQFMLSLELQYGTGVRAGTIPYSTIRVLNCTPEYETVLYS